MKSRLNQLGLQEALRLLSDGTISPNDLLESQIYMIRQFNEELKAFITVFQEPIKNARRNGTQGGLEGIPISIKDTIYVKDQLTTAGSKILKDFRPDYDATVVSKLKRAGAVLVGKTNTDEFAFGTTCSNPHYGACRNPYRRDHISGGSSGGSAVSVATGMCSASVGTDTGGSVRIPAAFCGLVGYKPTYGLVSRHGLIPLSWSLDTVGFLTKSVRDAALLASITFGDDGFDESTSPQNSVEIGGLKSAPFSKLRIGVPKNYFLEILHEDIRKRFQKAIESAAGEGGKITEVEIEHVEAIKATQEIIVHSEAASYHKEFVKTRFDEYGGELKERLAMGMIIPATSYLAAQRARRKLVNLFRKLFKRIDVLATPTTPIPAPPVGTTKVDIGGASLDIRTALLRLTRPINLACTPAISIPCGLTRDGLPVGLQLVADIFEDRKLLSVSLSFERILEPMPAPPP